MFPSYGQTMVPSEHLSKPHRIASFIGSMVLGFGLLVAMWLQPDGRGHGTHQQLGLPPCTFKFLLHIPCPACGMTTSWALAVRGDWQSAIQANSGGFVLFLITAVSVPLLLATSIRGRLPWSGLRFLGPTLLSSALLLALIQWTLRITL